MSRGRPRKEWTKQEEQVALDMRRDGFTADEIGKALHRGGRSVQAHFVDMKKREGTYKPRPFHWWSESELTMLKHDYMNGIPVTEIAAKLGVSKFAVYAQMKKLREG